jgi:hypothetical protein
MLSPFPLSSVCPRYYSLAQEKTELLDTLDVMYTKMEGGWKRRG